MIFDRVPLAFSVDWIAPELLDKTSHIRRLTLLHNRADMPDGAGPRFGAALASNDDPVDVWAIWIGRHFSIETVIEEFAEVNLSKQRFAREESDLAWNRE